MDDEGNEGCSLWKSVIKQADRKLTRTFDDQMHIATTTDYEENAPLEGDDDRWRNIGKSIGVRLYGNKCHNYNLNNLTQQFVSQIVSPPLTGGDHGEGDHVNLREHPSYRRQPL